MKVNSVLKSKCKELKKPYEMTMSYGCVKCSDSKKPYESYMRRADELLYECKKNR